MCYSRAPIFTEDILGGEGGEGEAVQPPERSFWAKYVSFREFIIIICQCRESFHFLIFLCVTFLSVDVPYPPRTHCHERHNSSNESAGGTGCWPVSQSSSTAHCSPAWWSTFCCAEKIVCLLISISRLNG